MKDKSCKRCGTKKNITRHHIFGKDYPQSIYLCRSCHNLIHNGKPITRFIGKLMIVSPKDGGK